MKYRVIALDLDGTLTNNEKEVTPKTREALWRAMDDGAVVVLASGRPTYGIEPVADCLELDRRGGYILSYNGAKIVNWATKEQLYAKHLPDGIIPEIYAFAQAHHYGLLGYKDNVIISENASDPYALEECRINKMQIRQVDYLLDHLEDEPIKLLMTGDPQVMERAEGEISDLLGDRIDAYRSMPFFIELVAKGIDKAVSLQRLLDLLHCTPSEMVAFGDGYNDLSMLCFAGMGVAMGNAVPEVRAIADYVTLSNEEDGIAAALACFEQDE